MGSIMNPRRNFYAKRFAFLAVAWSLGCIFPTGFNQSPRDAPPTADYRLAFLYAEESFCGPDGPCYGAIAVVNSDGTNQHVVWRGDNRYYPDFEMIASPSKNRFLYTAPLYGPKSIFTANIFSGEITEFHPPQKSWINGTAWSPDETAIVYSAEPERFGNVTLRTGLTEIYIQPTDGGQWRQLTVNDASDFWPFWSPDGEKIAFVSDRNGSDAIYLMDTNGTNTQQLTKFRAIRRFFGWSPDGRYLLFSQHLALRLTALYALNVETGVINRVSGYLPYVWEAAWSPNGKQILFTALRGGDYEIFVANVDGTNLHQLTDSDAHERQPLWSPDGTFITFLSNHAGISEIYRMDLDGGNLRRLTHGGAITYTWVR